MQLCRDWIRVEAAAAASIPQISLSLSLFFLSLSLSPCLLSLLSPLLKSLKVELSDLPFVHPLPPSSQHEACLVSVAVVRFPVRTTSKFGSRFDPSLQDPTSQFDLMKYWRWSCKTNTLGGKRPSFTGSLDLCGISRSSLRALWLLLMTVATATPPPAGFATTWSARSTWHASQTTPMGPKPMDHWAAIMEPELHQRERGRKGEGEGESS